MQTVTTCPTCNGEGTTTNRSNAEPVKVKAECMVKKPLPSIYLPVFRKVCSLALAAEVMPANAADSPGDLIVLIEEEQHKELHRDGLNVAYELHISFPDACFGTSVEVPTIDGRAKIKIPAGTPKRKNIPVKRQRIPWSELL